MVKIHREMLSVLYLILYLFNSCLESSLCVPHSHLSVRADVQSPQVCLLSCELIFSELYVEIPTKGTVKLFNQTLLPSHFKWMVYCSPLLAFTKQQKSTLVPHFFQLFLHQAQLQGKQASLCTTSFDPPSGTLGPNACMEVTVNFTAHTDVRNSTGSDRTRENDRKKWFSYFLQSTLMW